VSVAVEAACQPGDGVLEAVGVGDGADRVSWNPGYVRGVVPVFHVYLHCGLIDERSPRR